MVGMDGVGVEECQQMVNPDPHSQLRMDDITATREMGPINSLNKSRSRHFRANSDVMGEGLINGAIGQFVNSNKRE
jgi:hypothetical protein